MRGVITMNEEYETRFLCNSAKVTTDWERGMGQGQGQGRPPAASTTLAGPGTALGSWLGEREPQVTVPQRHVPQAFLPLQFRPLSLNGCGCR